MAFAVFSVSTAKIARHKRKICENLRKKKIQALFHFHPSTPPKEIGDNVWKNIFDKLIFAIFKLQTNPPR